MRDQDDLTGQHSAAGEDAGTTMRDEETFAALALHLGHVIGSLQRPGVRALLVAPGGADTRATLLGLRAQLDGILSPVFVFGSNLAGRHGAGAALHAKQHHGARYGQGEGLQGNSYAIPTKDGRDRAIPLTDPSNTLPLAQIAAAVARFLDFARDHPHLLFNVTAIGTGLAGYAPTQIAPLFVGAPPNCILPRALRYDNRPH